LLLSTLWLTAYYEHTGILLSGPQPQTSGTVMMKSPSREIDGK